jgi:diguanylate cyclase (GGDEF)-like protein
MVNRGEGRRLRVVIADDTEDVRSLLQYTFELDGRFEVVAQAANGAEALAAVTEHQPDALVLDLAMPVLDGLNAIPRIKAVAPRTRIVVLSGFGARQMAQQAVALGADSYVEKTTFQKLTSVLLEVCKPEEGEPIAEAPAEPPTALDADMPPAPSIAAGQPIDNGAGMLRQLRWVAAAFAVLQFALYHPPPGTSVPFPQWPVAALVAGWLLGVNVLTRRRSMPWVELVADSIAVLAVIGLFSFDGTSELWTLLLVPIIEGALRAQMRGAVLTWATTGAVYAVREVLAAAHYDRDFHLESLTYQLGVLLLVASVTGKLATNFAASSAQHERARADSERRAELLGLVAAASRRLAALNAEQLLEGVVDAAAAFGFEGVELCTYDEAAATWLVSHRRGVQADGDDASLPFDAAVPNAVLARQATVLLHDDGQSGAYSPGAAWWAAGFHSVVATPIRSGPSVTAALVTSTKRDGAVAAPEIECLELLAAQAGVGLANVRLLNRTRHQALHDSLTGLPNQLLFEDRVAQALTQASRNGTQVALLFTDLDRFKKINDNLGHDFGNELLRQVAGRLLGAVRAGDTVARMGGDEFTLLLPGLANDKDVQQVAGKVVEAMRTPFVIGDHQLFVSGSVGIAVYPSDGLRYESLLKHADIAMYRAKAAGGNSYALYADHSDDRTAYPRLTLEADLHMALPRHELRVVYQPQLDLADGNVVGVEALIRWSHPELGEVEPVEFLPLAEEAGLMGTLDTWVLQTACVRAASWLRQHDGPGPGLRMAVNVSGRQLQQPAFADTVLSVLARSGLPAHMLELEVTEGAAVTEVGGVRDALTRLRAVGVRIAIDDFGTGYSMLARLKDFPLDTLKIDRSFIAEIHDATDDAPIVSATIAMARSLGLEVVAEGVEEDAQLGFLREAGCDMAQGFLLSRPVEADQVIDLVNRPSSVLLG